MELKFNCKHCDAEIFSKFLKVGEEAKCKSCGKTTIVPDDAEVVSEPQIKEEHTISDVFNELKSKPLIIQNNDEKPKSKYPALKTISSIYKFLAWLVSIGAIIGIIFGIELPAGHGEGNVAGTSLIIYSLVAGFFGV